MNWTAFAILALFNPFLREVWWSIKPLGRRHHNCTGLVCFNSGGDFHSDYLQTITFLPTGLSCSWCTHWCEKKGWISRKRYYSIQCSQVQIWYFHIHKSRSSLIWKICVFFCENSYFHNGRLQSRFSFILISVAHNIKGFHVQICHRGFPGGEI